MHRLGRAKLAGLVAMGAMGSSLVASCIDEGRGTIFVDVDESSTRASFVESEDGLRIRIDLEAYIDTDGEVLLDSALVVVAHDDEETSFADPDIEATGFPLDDYAQVEIGLEVPNPIDDLTSFEAFCDANGRRADVTLRFFTTTIDPDPSEPPPLTEVATSVALVAPGSPKAPNVIDMDDVTSFVNLGTEVRNVTMGPAGTILFVAGDSSSLTARRGSVAAGESIDLSGYDSFPRLASNDPDVLYVGGVVESNAFRFWRSTSSEGAEFRIERDDVSPAYDTFNVVAMEPTATGMRAAVISAYPLVHPVIASEDAAPPDDKYYGSFIVEATSSDAAFEATAIVPSDREIVGWLPLSDGLLQLTNELPPRSLDTTFRVERLDEAGAVLWSHDEPGAGFGADADVLPDGSVLVTYEHAPGFVEVLRLDPDDGSEIARAHFSGGHPSVAAYGDDHVMLGFSGVAPFDGVVAPARSVPLLVELDADMSIVRGVQLACTGSADLQRAADGSLLMVGAFGQRFTLGPFITEVDEGTLILTKIADPL